MTTHFAVAGCIGTTLCGLSVAHETRFHDRTEAGRWACRSCMQSALRLALKGFDFLISVVW
jgi:hypothetical protein